ncbi:MAG TPA: LptE family protein [Terriglobales bacterium]|nr:LptE family protein [Terriglobales bacterium]
MSDAPRAQLPRQALVAALACSSLLWAGCGYHTAGHNTAIPEEVRTIAVPAFLNQTHTYKIEQMLTAAVARELTTRTHYHVIADQAGGADATLHGTVLSAYTTPLTYDSTTGRAASALVVISVSVSLEDKGGKLLYRNPSYLFREQYEISRDPNSFFEEDTPALARLSRDFAQTLVSNILEGF